MPDFLTVWDQPGVPWLALTVFIAGIVRGFTGFGTALIYVPIASIFLPPTVVIFTLIVMDFIGPLPLYPEAFRKWNRAEVLRMVAGAVVGVTLGIWLLTKMDPYFFRWVASSLVIVALIAIVSGWRYQGQIGPKLPIAVGGVSGFFGGFSGIGGPPVILFYLGGQGRAETIRANILIFFLFGEVISVTNFALRGLMTWEGFTLGLTLMIPYLIGNIIGGQGFKRVGEATFRPVAFVIIAIAALIGLPIFD